MPSHVSCCESSIESLNSRKPCVESLDLHVTPTEFQQESITTDSHSHATSTHTSHSNSMTKSLSTNESVSQLPSHPSLEDRSSQIDLHTPPDISSQLFVELPVQNNSPPVLPNVNSAPVMEGGVSNKKKKARADPFTEIVFSWSLDDILNDNLYQKKLISSYDV
ncbi:hypothetical protein FEM48_Zijuj10G0164600 [Ziziphus jujuba var. spinosa]|uniref:Uncharacterized protein n=1 Tax=Ziziphus jujuba var. spinosa TaxID=714518 RepID=A0A978UPG5_ZIZJJ|nr:hypothetical protein FEM48_Zijuj10G0164600 [Ziziphus jujuba var. spinosa]